MQKLVIASILALTAASLPAAVRVSRIASPVAAGKVLPALTGGRAEQYGADGISLIRQWPGTYFETRFRGTSAMFKLGTGNVALHVLVDGASVAALTKPAPGLYRIDGLAPGSHSLRIEIASESQLAPTIFGGFYAGSGTVRAALQPRRRQIEFIGDSHTVGYANTSSKQACTEDEIWRSTDTSQAFGPLWRSGMMPIIRLTPFPVAASFAIITGSPPIRFRSPIPRPCSTSRKRRASRAGSRA